MLIYLNVLILLNCNMYQIEIVGVDVKQFVLLMLMFFNQRYDDAAYWCSVSSITHPWFYIWSYICAGNSVMDMLLGKYDEHLMMVIKMQNMLVSSSLELQIGTILNTASLQAHHLHRHTHGVVLRNYTHFQTPDIHIFIAVWLLFENSSNIVKSFSLLEQKHTCAHTPYFDKTLL